MNIVSFSENPILFLEQNPVMFSMILFGIVLIIILTALHDQRKQNRQHMKRNEELAKMVSILRKKVIQIQQRAIEQSKVNADQINELKSQRAEAILEKERSEAEKINLHTQLNQTQTQMLEMRNTFNTRLEHMRKINDRYIKLHNRYEVVKDGKTRAEAKLREFMLGAVYGTLDIDDIKIKLKL